MLVQVVGHSAARCSAAREGAGCQPIRATPRLEVVAADGAMHAHGNRAYLEVRRDGRLLAHVRRRGGWETDDLTAAACSAYT